MIVQIIQLSYIHNIIGSRAAPRSKQFRQPARRANNNNDNKNRSYNK